MSDVLRRRIAITLLLIGVVVAVLAIEDLGPFDDPPTQADRARAAAEEFFAAAADGDSERFCEMLTADAREALRVSTAQRLQVDDYRSASGSSMCSHPSSPRAHSASAT